VPGSWDLAGYPLFGYGTYRLTLTSDEKRLMMLVPEIPDSALIYINGEEVFHAGRVGKNPSEFTSKIRNAFVTFELVNGQAEILIQVSNYTWIESGLRYPMEVGRPDVLLDDGMFRRVCVGVFAGMLLMMGLYHIILFFANKEHKAYLYFALLCIGTAFRFCIETNGLFQLFLDGGVSDFMFHIYITMMPVIVWILIFFTREVFQIPKPKRFQRAFFTVILAGITLTAIFVPYHVTGVEYIFLSIIPLVWTMGSAMKSPLTRKNPYLWLYLIAFVIYIFWGYLTKVIWHDELYMPGIASNLFMVMGQFVILAADYSSVRREARQLREKNQVLDGLNRIKNEFMSNMSHDMKTPLTVISVHIQRAEKLHSLDPKHYSDKIQESLKLAQQETMRVARMAKSTLDMAAQQETRANTQWQDITPILQSCAQTYRIVMEKRGNVIVTDIPQELYLWVNADLLIQVISNLFRNATNHTQNGVITLRAKATPEVVEIQVSDTGEGIDEAILATLFERGSSGNGGTGLGLSICRTIIRAHGGDIKVTSVKGEGTTVSFTFPFDGEKEMSTNEKSIHFID
jgi:signal transduction histidine kinase